MYLSLHFATMPTLCLPIVILLASLVRDVAGSGLTSRFQIMVPNSLRKDEGYDHREALFGLPPYGGSIQQQVYYADSTLCEEFADYSRGGYPTRPNDETGRMAPWEPPFFLMVDRGDCTFVQKTRNAQKAGASGVLIADNVCICGNPDCDSSQRCETKEPTMADDGSGSDITVPSFLLFKKDADEIKRALYQDTVVVASMSWELPYPDATVEYDFWSTPVDDVILPFKQSFREVAVALGERASATPHMYIYDGIFAGCHNAQGESNCYNLCTNNGRYCSADPDEDMEVGLSGADVVRESLRQLCIWRHYGDDGIGEPWWRYVEEFTSRCYDEPDSFKSEKCVEDAMKRAGVDKARVDKCMDDSGGLEGNIENSILEEEIELWEHTGIVILPAFRVNEVELRGAKTMEAFFEAICAGYTIGSEPLVCGRCKWTNDVKQCVINSGNRVPISSADVATVSLPFFVRSLFGLVGCFLAIAFFQWRREQTERRSEIREVLAEYMPLEEYNNSLDQTRNDETT